MIISFFGILILTHNMKSYRRKFYGCHHWATLSYVYYKYVYIVDFTKAYLRSLTRELRFYYLPGGNHRLNIKFDYAGSVNKCTRKRIRLPIHARSYILFLVLASLKLERFIE